MSSSKLINIFLPDGNPNGVKIIEIANRITHAILIPRTKLADVKDRPELNQPALYILCDRDGTQVYLGECERFISRVKTHDQSKDFWEIAIAFVASDNSLEKANVKYLESIAVELAKDAQRMEVMNAVVPARNNLHEFRLQTTLDFFEDVKLLASTLGFPLFDKIDVEDKDESQIWYCNRRLTKARAVYDENGFTVLKGSIIDGSHQPSFIKYYPSAVTEREQLFMEHGVVSQDGKTFELTNNVTFTSANKAGGFVVGANVNAWTNWKNKAGKTMDEVLRQGL